MTFVHLPVVEETWGRRIDGVLVILQLLRRTSRVPDTKLTEDTSISEPCSTRASDVDSIVELEGTTSRLVRADDLATIDVERSLCAIVNEGNVIPRIRLSTFEVRSI